MRSTPFFGPESQTKYRNRLTSFFSDPYLMNLSMASETPNNSRFGDIAVITFMVVQALDGVLTYLGVHIWGPSVEANPLISSAVSLAGVGVGVAIAKLF